MIWVMKDKIPNKIYPWLQKSLVQGQITKVHNKNLNLPRSVHQQSTWYYIFKHKHHSCRVFVIWGCSLTIKGPYSSLPFIDELSTSTISNKTSGALSSSNNCGTSLHQQCDQLCLCSLHSQTTYLHYAGFRVGPTHDGASNKAWLTFL